MTQVTISRAKELRDSLPDSATESDYVRWLVIAVYFLLCEWILGREA